jgi:hypothetical protein
LEAQEKGIVQRKKSSEARSSEKRIKENGDE